MIETIILEEPAARERYRTAPCLEEREQYLFHLMRQGYGPDYLRTVSGVMLRVVRFLGLTTLRTVGLDEIERAGRAWTAYRGPDRRGTAGATPGRFPRVAKNWLRFHGRLAVPPAPVHRTKRKSRTSLSSCVRRTVRRPQRFMDTARERSYSVHGWPHRARLFRL